MGGHYVHPYLPDNIKSNNMKHPLWSDEYWLLLMQLYLKKPMGIKPMYSRGMVDLSLELHIPPSYLYQMMFALRSLDTPRMEKLWQQYGNDLKRLSKEVKRLREMQGFNSAGDFYDGVDVQESFEKDFRPIPTLPQYTPIMLVLILDLYFRLTPLTMVRETPEIQELARLMHIKAEMVVEVMTALRVCDPYLNHKASVDDAMLAACKETWQRHANGKPQDLAALAAQLKEYFLN